MGFQTAFTGSILKLRAVPRIRPTIIVSPIKRFSSDSRARVLFSKPCLADYSKDAIQFFTSIRIPAALIAGSSLGALFVMTTRVSHPENEHSRGQRTVLFLYHVLCMASYLLSVNVVATSTSASNTILIGDHNPMATSAYEFLLRETKYEYLITRWSFYTALICFINSIGFRVLLEFDLLKRTRIRSLFFVGFSTLSLVSHILHVVNDCLYTFPNFYLMTVGVLKVYFERVFEEKSSMLLLSSSSGIAASLMFLVLFFKSINFGNDER